MNLTAMTALAFAAIAMCGIAKADVRPNQNEEAPVVTTKLHKSYMGFSGDCYNEGPVSTINRCLVESTRAGGGAR